jgi:TonB family protein
VSIPRMLSQTRAIALALLVCCGCAQASPRCALASLHDQVMTAADVNMGPFVLFRGEVAMLPKEDKQSAGSGCCDGANCPKVLCSKPRDLIPRATFLDYSVNETLWGETANPVIHAWYQAVSPCGHFHPMLHEKIITLCSPPVGAAEGVPAWCERPIADTEENLRAVQGWIPQANQRRQRTKVSEEAAQAHLTYRVKPVYPKVDTASKLKGDVVVRIFISRLGTVQSIRPVSGPSMLTQSAVNAVSLWRYKPFRANGSRIKVDTTVTVHF